MEEVKGGWVAGVEEGGRKGVGWRGGGGGEEGRYLYFSAVLAFFGTFSKVKKNVVGCFVRFFSVLVINTLCFSF